MKRYFLFLWLLSLFLPTAMAFTAEVSRVDYGFYQYRKSLNLHQTNDELLGLFTEPTQVYSNVKNGVGVVCSQSLPVTFSIDLGDGER